MHSNLSCYKIITIYFAILYTFQGNHKVKTLYKHISEIFQVTSIKLVTQIFGFLECIKVMSILCSIKCAAAVCLKIFINLNLKYKTKILQ